MRKAFDADVPKVKPRLRSAAAPAATLEVASPAEDALPAAPGEPSVAETLLPEAPARPPQAREEARAAEPVPAPREAARQAPSDLGSRRERLEKIKRKVAEAARRGSPAATSPREPARAAESALSLVSDMEVQLSRSRDLEEALRADLQAARSELGRAAGELKGFKERLAATDRELEEKRAVLSEMLAEMAALEEERDQAVRRAQALSALDEERQKVADDLSRRADELEGALAASRTEGERLTAELEERTADGTRVRTALAEAARERDSLSRELAEVRRERDELLEARSALEKVHEALSQARARLG